MSIYIYSTSTHSHNINGVFIKGGANLADKHFYTPRGVATSLTEEQYNAIKDSRIFQALENAGLFSVSKKETDANKAAKNMTKKDKSAPKAKEDFEKNAENVSVVTGA